VVTGSGAAALGAAVADAGTITSGNAAVSTSATTKAADRSIRNGGVEFV
jgi:hypothetical protein